tara:strand:- start:167 stop:913 length:747 start_codon:yes stop_codon:yes gene_type:complete
MIKKIIKKIFNIISKIIFKLIPVQFKKETLKSKLQKKLEDSLTEETYNNFYNHFKTSLLFGDKIDLRKYAVERSIEDTNNDNDYFLEFGCYNGNSANFFSNYVKKLYTFDSFEGLKEDWIGREYSKGHFNLNKKKPYLNSNVEPVVGWIENTLESFLKDHNPEIRFVHMDLDTYTSTKFTLERIKPYLKENSYIIFDDFFNYVGWESGEYKAFNEIFDKNEFEYKAFNLGSNYQETLFATNNCLVRIK